VDASLEELAEDTAVHLLPQPFFELVDRGSFCFEAGAHRGAVHRIRLGDVAAALEWSRAEARRRKLTTVEWWVGWHATPTGLGRRLLDLGLVPDEPPSLTGMTCTSPPPGAPDVDVRPIETLEEQLTALEVDWEVWQLTAEERAQRAGWEREHFEASHAAGARRQFAAFLDGRCVGFGRGIDMEQGVALMGGAVLPEARGRGVYRALVRARWDHAVRRGTPLLVVQAGPLSAPILASLGFVAHGEISLYADRL
jgi:GNAT superfamily N-acetyltransferase